MIFAFVAGDRVAASPDVKGETATCPLCGSRVIAKCGQIKAWHWAHESMADCDPWSEGETEWHLEWKMLFQAMGEFSGPSVEIEKTIGNHRADIVVDGCVVELQHSPISTEEVHERENFYGSRMCWIVDALKAVSGGRFTARSSWHYGLSGETIDRDWHSYSWKHRIKWIEKCSRLVWLDVSSQFIPDTANHHNALFHIQKSYGRSGWGWFISDFDYGWGGVVDQVASSVNGEAVMNAMGVKVFVYPTKWEKP